MAEYALTINGSKMKLGERGVSPRSLSVRYNQPSELTMETERADVALGSVVRLTVDGVSRFEGTIIEEPLNDRLSGWRTLVAIDAGERASQVMVERWNWALGVGQLWTVFYNTKFSAELSVLLDAITTAAGAGLAAAGAVGSASAVFSGSRSGTIPWIQLRATNVQAMLEQILAPLPNLRWIWDPSTQTFKIVDVLKAPEQTISVPSMVSPSWPLTRSLRGRYSRVKLIGQGGDSLGTGTVTLTPAWNASLEANWTMAAAQSGAGTAISDVYRLFSFAGMTDHLDLNLGIDVLQAVLRWPGDSSPIWHSVQVAEVDEANQWLRLQMPAVQGQYTHRRAHRDANLPGKAIAASVAMNYYKVTPTGPPQVSVGPAGSAYSLYGWDRELLIEEQNNYDVTAERAKQYLDAVKDELVSGSVSIAGEVPSWLWSLNCRVGLAAAGRKTGLESLGAIVSGFTRDFLAGTTSIELSNDRSPFTGRAFA